MVSPRMHRRRVSVSGGELCNGVGVLQQPQEAEPASWRALVFEKPISFPPSSCSKRP
jgi:hypothetical protein